MKDPVIDHIDVMARRKSIKILKEKFGQLAKDILEGKKPVLILPKRVLTNTIYDVKRKLLLLGPEMKRRSLLDVNEARKFMQTLLMASIIYEALINNEYPTIRDLYYRGKHTITYRDPKGRIHHENTWDEQRESDAVIRDIEVLLGLLREEMLILSKEKGKVVGNLVIRSGDDVIDLSKMGHGAYAIEPTPDLIEFKDVDAEFVLVVEKDAVFQQLHRYGFWKKYHAILVTSAGQPDRATRRFIRRLNDELKLPIYILTDSIPADEVVIVKDLKKNKVMIGPIEEIVGKYFNPNKERERITIPLAVPSFNPLTGRIEWSPIGYVYRHRIRDKILRLKIKGRGIVRVTKAHSLFIYRNGKIIVEPAYNVKPGDHIVIAEKLPRLVDKEDYVVVNIARLLLENKNLYNSTRFKLENTLWLGMGDNTEIRLREASDYDIDNAVYVRLSRSKARIPNKIVVDEEVAWLFGLYIAEGSRSKDRYLSINLGKHEAKLVRRVIEILEKRFNITPLIRVGKGITILISSKILRLVFEALGLTGTAKTKRIPSIILNSPTSVKISFIKGLIDGDGHIDKYGDIIYSTRSQVLSKQLFILLLSLGINPSLVINGKDYVIRIRKSTIRTPSKVYSALTSLELTNKLITEPSYGIPINTSLKHQLILLANTGRSSYHPGQATISKAKLHMLHTNKLLSIPSDLKTIIEGDSVLARVESVMEEDYEGYVYDFAVPVNNSFIGGWGIVYHNSDPYGWYIYSVFKIGSITLSYESERLATPTVKFLGVSMSDVFGDERVRKYARKLREILGDEALKLIRKKPKKPYLTEKERKNYIIRAKTKDIERAIELIGYDIAYKLITNPEIRAKIRGKEGIAGYPWFRTVDWIREISIFFDTLAKLEIEAMASKGLKFLADNYIPTKIETGDWID